MKNIPTNFFSSTGNYYSYSNNFYFMNSFSFFENTIFNNKIEWFFLCEEKEAKINIVNYKEFFTYYSSNIKFIGGYRFLLF
jgi:hypothetical protein